MLEPGETRTYELESASWSGRQIDAFAESLP
jgi:hypothetical protein